MTHPGCSVVFQVCFIEQVLDPEFQITWINIHEIYARSVLKKPVRIISRGTSAVHPLFFICCSTLYNAASWLPL